MPQFTKEQAISLAEKKVHLLMTPWQRLYHQVDNHRLFMPFDRFHEAADKFYPGIMTLGLTTLTTASILALKPADETFFDFSSHLE